MVSCKGARDELDTLRVGCQTLKLRIDEPKRFMLHASELQNVVTSSCRIAPDDACGELIGMSRTVLP